MIPVSPAAAAAITAKQREISPVLSVDWDADGHGGTGTIDDLTGMVSGLSRDQAWTSDLPEQVRVVEGNAVAQVQATLAKGDILGPGSTVTYVGASSAGNDATLDFGAALALPANVQPGDAVLIALAVWDLTITVDCLTDLEPLLSVTDATTSPGLRTIYYQHRHRPAVDPYDPASEDVDSFYQWSFSADTRWSAGAVALRDCQRITVFDGAAHIADASTSHGTPEIRVPDNSMLVTVGAFVATAGTWTPPSGDTERVDVTGTYASNNVALSINTSPLVAAGAYTRVLTSSASSACATAATFAAIPFPALDERMHAAAYLSESNLDSPLSPKRRVRRSCYYDVAILTADGPEYIRRLTGLTREVGVSARARTATLDALDYRERMRRDIHVPSIPAHWNQPDSPMAPGLNASWLVSWACYQCGIPVSPQPTFTATRMQIAWVPMHGSLHPMYSKSTTGIDDGYEVSYSGSLADVFSPTWVAGPFLLGAFANGAAGSETYKVRVNARRPGSTVIVGGSGSRKGRVEFWVRGDTIAVAAILAEGNKEAVFLRTLDTGDITLQLYAGVATDGRVTLRIAQTGADILQLFGPTVPTDGDWHFVGVTWDFDAGTKVVKLRCDSTTTTSNPVFVATFAGEAVSYLITSYMPVAELHITASTSTEPWLNEATFVPEAIIDHSLLDLAGSTVTGQIEAWQLIADLAKAEQAVAAWDEDGIFRYRTRKRLVDTAGQTVQVVLADDTHVTDLDLNTSVDRVRNVIQVPWTTPEGKLTKDYIWQSTTSVKLPKPLTGGGVSISQPVNVPIGWSSAPMTVDTSLVIQTATPPNPTDSYFIVNTRADGLGTNVTTGVTAVINGWTAAGAQITIDSLRSSDAYLIEAAVVGYSFGSQPEATSVVEDEDSIRRYRRQPLAASASPWLQTDGVATRLGQLILADTRQPVAVITSLRIVGDPRLQLGDRVRIVDRYGAHLDGEYWLTSVDESWSGGKYVMTVSARQASTVGVWGQSRWGQAVWGAAA